MCVYGTLFNICNMFWLNLLFSTQSPISPSSPCDKPTTLGMIFPKSMRDTSFGPCDWQRGSGFFHFLVMVMVILYWRLNLGKEEKKEWGRKKRKSTIKSHPSSKSAAVLDEKWSWAWAEHNDVCLARNQARWYFFHLYFLKSWSCVSDFDSQRHWDVYPVPKSLGFYWPINMYQMQPWRLYSKFKWPRRHEYWTHLRHKQDSCDYKQTDTYENTIIYR